MVLPSISSSPGIARNHVSRSIERSYFDYGFILESLGLAASTINQRLAAVRRLAYEAADSGLRSPELAAGIRRVKGVKQLGSRSGNWLNLEQASLLLANSNGDSLRNERDLAMIAILLGCRLRRAELATFNIEDIQIRQRHWALVDLIGKGGYIRTVLGKYPPSAGKSNILVLGRDAVRGRPDTVPCAQAGRDP